MTIRQLPELVGARPRMSCRSVHTIQQGQPVSMLTTQQAAAALNVSRAHVLQLVANNTFKDVEFTKGHHRIPDAEVERVRKSMHADMRKAIDEIARITEDASNRELGDAKKNATRQWGPKARPATMSDYAPAPATQALLRLGRPQMRTRLQAADMATVKEACGLAGLTADAFRQQVANGNILGLKGAGLGLRLPRWQFSEPMRSAMPKVISGLVTLDPWAVLSFLETPHGALGGRTPRVAIEQGKSERVVALAASE